MNRGDEYSYDIVRVCVLSRACNKAAALREACSRCWAFRGGLEWVREGDTHAAARSFSSAAEHRTALGVVPRRLARLARRRAEPRPAAGLLRGGTDARRG